MDIHVLEADLDLKQNLNIYAVCKQLDTLHLIFNIFYDGVQADLSGYNVRLKAMKSDNVPLIQDTQYTVSNNVVKIIASEQLTTTSGTTKIEVEFINKITGERKASSNLNLKVTPSTLEAQRSISTATYTLLEKLENKVDQASNITENIDKAIEINKNLTTTITDGTNAKNVLEADVKSGNGLITSLEDIIGRGNKSNVDLETTINKGDNLKVNLEAANTQAKVNIAAMKVLGDVSKLAENVQTNINEIQSINTQLTEKASTADLNITNTNVAAKASDIDSSRTTTAKTVTGAINELNISKANKDGSLQSNLNADMIDGYHVNSSNSAWGVIPRVGNDGVMEVGKYIDFHITSTGNVDNDVRLTAGSGTLSIQDFKIMTALSGGYKMQTGSIGASLVSNGQTNVSVTFSVPFSSAPNVVASLSDVGYGAGTLTTGVGVGNTTATGCTLVIKNNSASTAAITITWIAIGY